MLHKSLKSLSKHSHASTCHLRDPRRGEGQWEKGRLEGEVPLLSLPPGPGVCEVLTFNLQLPAPGLPKPTARLQRDDNTENPAQLSSGWGTGTTFTCAQGCSLSHSSASPSPALRTSFGRSQGRVGFESRTGAEKSEAGSSR